MSDKFNLQYGIKKVIIEIEIDELNVSIKDNTYGDALAETLDFIRSYVYHTDFVGEVIPFIGVTMTEYNEAGEKIIWKDLQK